MLIDKFEEDFWIQKRIFILSADFWIMLHNISF